MRRTSVLTYLSILALIAAVVSEALGWTQVRGWLLLAWAVLLLPVSIGLFGHPMKAPALGLFVGVWGTVAVVVLIVLQALAIAGVLGTEWTAWPLEVIGIWFIVASLLGFGAPPFPPVVDFLGVLAGAGLIAIGGATAADDAAVLRVAGVAAAVAYVLWAAALGWIFWGMQGAVRTFRGMAVEPRA
jgi:hypothetical protein